MKAPIKEKPTSDKRMERIERNKKRRKKRISKDDLYEMKWR